MMTGDKSLQFVAHLRASNRLTKTGGHGEPAEQGGSERPQGKLWELTDLSASEFADEAARFWGLRRLNLQDLMNATSAAEHFSARFLRESSVFPFRLDQGRFGLAVSDPTDAAAIRAPGEF